MPKKGTTYQRVKLDAQAYEDLWDTFEKVHNGDRARRAYSLSVTTGETTWKFDDWHEFLGAVREPHDTSSASFATSTELQAVYLAGSKGYIYTSVAADTRGTVERLSAPLDRAADRLRQPEPIIEVPIVRPRVFVGHGRSHAWRDLKDHLHDLHGYDVEAYETGARAGHTIRDVLEQMLTASTFAILVMTGEDEQAAVDGAPSALRARQNVVHEAGLFQGRLGFARVIILLEEGTEPFSNVDGVQYIPFGRGRIREAFGDVLATLRREFP